MKKTFLIFLAILVGVYGILTFVDKSDYALEKRLWRIQRDFDRIARDPNVIPPEQFDRIVSRYRKLIKKNPGSALVPKIYMQIGVTYSLKKEFDKAREAYQMILTQFPDNGPLCALALLNIGNTYDNEGQEQKAMETYDRILKEYPYTDVGLNTPLFIANYYLRKEDPKKYEKALNDAVNFYKEQSAKFPNSPVEFSALRLLVTAYYAKKDWSAAFDTLAQILLKYAGSKYMNPQRAGLLLRSINTLAMTQLQDYGRAKKVYQDFMKQNPDHPLNKILEKMVEAFEKLEEEGVTVQVPK